MVRFTDDANRFWLEQSLDKGEMPKRDKQMAKTITFQWVSVPTPCVLTFLDGTKKYFTMDLPRAIITS